MGTMWASPWEGGQPPGKVGQQHPHQRRTPFPGARIPSCCLAQHSLTHSVAKLSIVPCSSDCCCHLGYDADFSITCLYTGPIHKPVAWEHQGCDRLLSSLQRLRLFTKQSNNTLDHVLQATFLVQYCSGHRFATIMQCNKLQWA